MRRVLTRLYPEERELIVRSGGRVRYLRARRPVQIAATALVAGTLLWSAYATTRFLGHDAVVGQLDSVIEALHASNAELSSDLATVNDRFAIQRQSLTATQQTTIDLISSNRALHGKLAELEGRVAAQARRADAFAYAYLGEVEARAAIARAAGRTEHANADLERRLVDRDNRLADLSAERDSLNANVASFRNEVRRLKEDVGTLDYARADLLARLNASERRLRSAVEAKLEVDGARAELGARVAELSDRLEALEAAQYDVVARLGEQADQSSEALRRTLDLAGLDVERLLDRLSRAGEGASGIGGPFLSLDDAPGSELAQKIAVAERRIDDLASLHELMQRLPLSAPLDEYRLTSGYGRRVDPFTSDLAFHSGIDLASRHRAAVHVTSPGTVTFVGWKGGFGKMVEVDHGLGVRTRYGHLSTIFVKRGQVLEFREKVGLVGNTGRSSGEHLHYEVVIDGRPYDPANFIKAGQYVFKN
jgi:murein DD-endopeptidase MepM/ murein hydrolase activator NlpD